MQLKYSIGRLVFASGLTILCVLQAAAQDVEANPPDVSPATGMYGAGANTLGGIESVNPVNGNVALHIPIAQLPADNASLSAGVSLIYNSAIYDAPTVPILDDSHAEMFYTPSAHGGGWNYGYKYKLWAQPRIPATSATSYVCGLLTSDEKTYWYKNFLQTPDGANHILYLVSEVPTTGKPTSDSGAGYLSTDFGGLGNPNSSCGTQQQYTGKLVFATVDGSYIRVEVTTAPGAPGASWIAYLPNGTQISGAVSAAQVGGEGWYADDSPAGTITDRNGNQINIYPLCQPGQACTETIQDLPGRSIEVSYVSSGSTSNNWTDTISWDGPNGALNATVNSTLTTAPSYSYPCGITTSGSDGIDCTLTASLWQVSSIQMAPATTGGNQTTFAFNYSSGGPNNWGELHTLQKCSGVGLTSCSQPQWSVNYQYVFDNGSLSSRPPGDTISPIQQRVLTYTENLDRIASTQIQEKTNYSIWYQPNSAYTFYGGETITPPNTITNPDGGVTTLYLSSLCQTSTVSRDTCNPVVNKTVNPDSSTTQLMWSWNQSLPAGVPAGTLFNLYPSITAETRAGTTRGSAVSRDTNGNVTQVLRYDWGSTATDNGNGLMTGLSGTVLQTIGSAYYYQSSGIEYWNASPNQGNLRALESEAVNGTELAQYSYDNPYTTANLTQIQRWDSGQNSWISQTMSYLSNGNLTSQTDGNHNLTAICYDNNDNGIGLYPVTTVTAASSYSCPTPTEKPEGRTTTYSSDLSSGVMKSATDTDNGLATSYTYDNLGRQTGATQTGAGSLERASTTTYDDVGLTVQTTQSDTGSGSLVSTTDYDALGRTSLVTDGAGHKTAEAYRYDGSGGKMRYVLQSNAYGAGSGPDTMTAGWTLTKLDSVGRTIEADHYSGTAPPAPWGSNSSLTGRSTIAYDQNISGCAGPATQITDEAGNAHWNCSDGLDRLVSVTEPDPAEGTYGTVTKYSYDSLGNLSTVDSVGGLSITCPNNTTHLRCFTYSTMSKLLSATSPESGTVNYTYDNNGNLLTETDANGSITTVAAYDGLNRPVALVADGPAVSYTTGNTGNPTVATSSLYYGYDQDFKGALSSVCTSMSSPCAGSSAISATKYTHDGFGRIAGSTQTTGGQPYPFSYGYSLTDQLTSMTYPSGRQVTYNLDAADRVTAVNNVTDGGTYANGISYTADGGLYGMTVGQGVTQSVAWNDRSQSTGLTVNATGGSPLLTLGLFPCPGNATACSSGNNGNLQGQTITTPSLSLTQQYGYDRLNRLTSAQESGGAPWGQGYGYDSLGNRWVSANGGLPALTNETPQSSSWFSTTVPNRIAVSGWNYDKNGNLLQVGGVGSSYTYDAANEQVTASVNGIAAQYVYDGNGERVEKTVTGGASTVYVYDAFGNLASEYSSSTVTLPCGQSICYPALDQLGSTRLVTDGNGSSVSPSVVQRYDYQPFGTELLAGINGRTTGNGYLPSPDGYLEKYTGQQRDQESGLDWFQARYMDSAQGRFQSPDPGNAGASLGDPQSWNGYSYVGNNPLSFIDPSGMVTEAGGGGDDCLICVVAVAAVDAVFSLFESGSGGSAHLPSTAYFWQSQSATSTGGGAARASASQGSSCLATPNFVGHTLLGGLVSAARAAKGTVGYGIGGSIGGGLGRGIAVNASGSVQVIASQDGTAAIAITYPGGALTTNLGSVIGFGTKGFGGIFGVQGMLSNGKTVKDADGPALDGGVSLAPEGASVAGAVDVSLGSGSAKNTVIGVTGTVGVGFGGKAVGGQRTQTTVIPFCSHF